MANIVLIPNGLCGLNYSIAPSVASSDLTVAIKDAAGNNPSATSPCVFRVGASERILSTSLSVTKADGTNWANLGSAELATKEADLFVYIVWNTNTSALDVLWSRIPYASVYSDFSATTTNEKYGAINATAPASTDDVVNIGRFSATLSAGAGYTWTVPTFTSVNLINRPIFETRILSFSSTLTNVTEGNGTKTSVYQKVGNRINYDVTFVLGSTSSVSSTISISLPTTPASHGSTYLTSGQAIIRDTGTALFSGIAPLTTGNTATLYVFNSAGTYGVQTATSNTVPMTWANTDEFSVSGSYVD